MSAPLVFTETPVDAYACTLSGLTATAPDGRTAPLDQCAWMQVAPCGCVSGVTTTVHCDEVLHTADLAMRSMATNTADYREDVKNGLRMVLVLWDDYRAGAGDLFKHKCEHDPQWGVRRASREIDGLTWTRIGSTRWDCTARNGKHWGLEKWSARWHLSGPPQGDGRYRGPYLGSGLNDALGLATAYIAEHPDGLERVTR